MSFFVYDSAIEDQVRAEIDFESDRFKVILLDATYMPSKRGHARRSDVTPNEIAGLGYKRGGAAVDVRLSRNGGSDTLDITLGGAEWEKSTIAAKGAVYYLSRGVATDDPLIAYVGFEKSVSTFNGLFKLTESLIRFENR